MSIRQKVAALATSGIVLAGCSGTQDSPARTLQSAYEHIADSEFEDLCELIDPRTTAALARWAGSCQAAMASDFIAPERAALTDVTVQENFIDIEGDVAKVGQGGAMTPAGPVTTFKMLIKHDGKWWIAR